jgi:hypothetical protein
MLAAKLLDNPPWGSIGVVTDMVSTQRITTGASLLAIALLFAAGPAMAQADAIADAGGEAAAQAEGAAYADASGAADAAEDHKDEAHGEAYGEYEQQAEAYEEAKGEAWTKANETEEPEPPECECEDEVFAKAEQASNVQAEHADQIDHATDAETEYVDAGGELSAAGQVSAWFSDAVGGVADAYNDVKGLMGFDTDADEEAKAQAEQALEAEEEVRGEAEVVLAEDPDLPDVDPSADASVSVQHAQEATTSAVGEVGT